MKLLSPIISIIILVLFAPSLALAATLSVSPATGTFNKGCSFSIDIKLDTGGVATDGTDAILLFDASKFTANTITPGTIYSDLPGNNIDNNKGVITTSGLASISSPFTGQGTLGTINFTVKDTVQTGAAMISFDFDSNDKAKTTDSNVVQRGGSIADVLASVTNGNYTIGTGSCAGAVATPRPQGNTGSGSAQVTPQPKKTVDQLVDGTGKGPGTPELTFMITIVGSILTVLGILGLALL